ncbi:MAG TPA: hypothetical protein P5110_00305 [Candidatus Omnitrophota bacterium]|nr:hypothetical protein [Candidatus Omnitrophota bacterium]
MNAYRMLIVVCLLAMAACLAGCETMAAFSTGKIKTSDLAYLTSTGTGGGEYYEDVGGVSGTRAPGSFSGRIEDADAWIKKNLW